MTNRFTHTTDDGDASLVDVGDKPVVRRRAVASGEIHLASETIAAVRSDEGDKGDVVATARVGAIQAVKHTWESIPLCHQIPITNVNVDLDVLDGLIELTVTVESIGQTGCEMEAIHGVSTGLSVIWDMVKSMEKSPDGSYPETVITNIRVLEKTKTDLGGPE